jgi:hypothetical protein
MRRASRKMMRGGQTPSMMRSKKQLPGCSPIVCGPDRAFGSSASSKPSWATSRANAARASRSIATPECVFRPWGA